MTRLLLALALLAAPLAARAQDLGVPVGSKAPAAVVESLDGKPVDLGAWIGKTPLLIEFWQDGAFRLHDRVRFTRADSIGPWSRQRLYP